MFVCTLLLQMVDKESCCGSLEMSYGKDEGSVVGRTIMTMRQFYAFIMDKFIVITWLMDFGLLAKER
jgi:hypothetical protein